MALFYSGTNASLSVNGTKLGKVREWSIEGTAETVETTVLDDYSPTYRTLRQSYSGSLKLFYYRDEDENVESKSVLGVVLSPNTAGNDLVVLELASSDMMLKFDAVIKRVSLSASTGQVMQADVSFLVNGPLKTVNLGGVN